MFLCQGFRFWFLLWETKFDKLPAKQWIDKFAKGEEAKWTGLTDWLNQQQGSVSKADIQKFLKDNRIEIVEVVKGDNLPLTGVVKKRQDLVDKAAELGYVFNWYSTRDTYPTITTTEGRRVYEDEIPAEIADLADAAQKLTPAVNTAPIQDTKFSQYQLEGQKENYKEIMIVLPREGSMKKVGDYTVPSAHKYGEDLADNRRVVHLRMNTRTDAEGRKVLFVEEVQSDWGQKGKKEGFLLTEKEAGKAWEEADKKYADFMKRMENKYGSEWEIEMEKMEVEEETKLLDARENTKGGTIQQAPFVTDTNAWTKLGLKVALKEAVTQGADKISWTTGEQQNDRYDLSKQVDTIDAKRNKDGTYEVQADKDGSKIFGKSDMSIKDIEDTFGKDIAQKINDSESRLINISGDNLKAGGKGMKGFYGEPSEGKEGIVGGVAKALVKELTGKPGEIVETKINNPEIPASELKIIPAKLGQFKVVDKEGNALNILNTEEKARQWIKDKYDTASTQHSIEITPELRAAVEKGQPLFKEAEAQYRIESGKNIIEAIKDFDGSPRATVALTHEIMHPTVVSIIDGAKEGNAVGKKHIKTVVDEFNKKVREKKKAELAKEVKPKKPKKTVQKKTVLTSKVCC